MAVTLDRDYNKGIPMPLVSGRCPRPRVPAKFYWHSGWMNRSLTDHLFSGLSYVLISRWNSRAQHAPSIPPDLVNRVLGQAQFLAYETLGR
jgi:hypothetical protein